MNFISTWYLFLKEKIYSRNFYFLIFQVPNECKDKTCGQPCSKGICNGNGWCVSVLENPCAVHGCEGKKCGQGCLMGDILGTCDASGNCKSSTWDIHCPGNRYLKQFNLFDYTYFSSINKNLIVDIII